MHALFLQVHELIKLNINPSSNAETIEICSLNSECCLWYDGKRGRRGDSKFSGRPIRIRIESNLEASQVPSLNPTSGILAMWETIYNIGCHTCFLPVTKKTPPL